MRYAGIYHQGRFYSNRREGLQSLLSEDELKRSVVDAFKRWETRLSLSSKLGNAIYSLTKYEKVNRLTFPIGEDGMILVSAETSLDTNTIIDQVVEIKKKSFS